MRKLLVLLLGGTLLLTGPAAVAQPSNDDRANATSIGALPYADAADTTDATVEQDEPWSACGPAGATAWYAYDSAAAATLTADTDGSGFDTLLAVYRQTGSGDLEEVACNDDAKGGADPTASVTFDAIAGDHLLFQAGGYSDERGALTFSLTQRSGAPANDNFENATLITDLPYEDTQDMTEATTEDSEPLCMYSFRDTAWYRYQPASDQIVRARVDTQAYAAVTVYRGTSIDDLECVSPGDTRAITFSAEAGTTYFFQVGADPFDSYMAQMTFSLDVAPDVDLAITHLSVKNVPLRTDAGTVPSGFARRTTVEVTNLGSDASSMSSLYVEACPKTVGLCSTLLSEDYMELGAGASWRRTVDWNGYGVGDYDITAHVYVDDGSDINPDNDSATVRHYVLVGGAGVGVGA